MLLTEGQAHAGQNIPSLTEVIKYLQKAPTTHSKFEIEFLFLNDTYM